MENVGEQQACAHIDHIPYILFYSKSVLTYLGKADWKNIQQNIFVEAFWCLSSINPLFLYAQLSALSLFINRIIEEIDPKVSTKKFVEEFSSQLFGDNG